MAEAGDYGSESIQVLEGLEAVRKRPGMYIGGTGARGLHHLVYEVVDNSVDEAMADHCSRIQVSLLEDNVVEVSDDGRGIPIEEHPEYGVPAVEVVMTRLHAGGKFDHKSYKVSGGLHGVGVSVVNALSEWLVVEVRRDGKFYRQRFERGVPSRPEVEEDSREEGSGTTVRFRPDPELFGDGRIRFDSLVERMRELAFLNEGLKITISSGDEERTFRYEGGISSFVEHVNRNRDPLTGVVHLDDGDEEVRVEAALQWTSEYVSSVFAFANNINTREGGTHLSGFRGGLTRAVNEYAEKEAGVEERFSGDDVREGLTAVISVMIPEPQFEGQTKTKLGNSEVRGVVESIVYDGVSRFLQEHPTEADGIVEKALHALRARKAASEAKKLTRRKNALKSTRLPGKLADCSSRKREGTELFIVEGDSAGGSAKQARDREFQAILPLKGKILNVEKARLDRILNNDEIRSLITALGTGIGDEFDLDDARYSKAIIMSVDGEEHGLVRGPGGEARLVRIGEFIDSVLGMDGEFEGYDVLCFGLDDHETRFRQINYVVRHEIEEPLYEIETAYGRSVKVTASHSIFVYRDGEVELARGDDIKEGDLVVAPRNVPLPMEREDEIDLVEALMESGASCSEVFLQGGGAENLLKKKVLAEHTGTEAARRRGRVPKEVLHKLKAAREEGGLTQSDVCEAVGVKQPITVSHWEGGINRPSLENFEAYCDAVGVPFDDVANEIEVKSSQLEEKWSGEYSDSGRNRVRSRARLSELEPGDLDRLPDDADVELTPEHYADRGIGRFVKVDETLMELMGFYVAEGSCSPRNGIRLSVDEERLVEKYLHAFQHVFGIGAKFYGYEERTGEVKLLNRPAAIAWREVLELDAETSSEKSIPGLVFNARPEERRAFLRGLLDGDGTVAGDRVTWYTASRGLASGLMYLLSSLGVTASLSVTDADEIPDGEIRGEPIRTVSDRYTVTVSARSDLERIREVWSGIPGSGRIRERVDRGWDNEANRSFEEVSDDLFALPVRSVREVEPSGRKVYDFSVEEDENFVAGIGGLCAHNTDADEDGAHIETLLLTFLYRYMKPLIEREMVYLAKPPLYRVRKGGGDHYVYTEGEKEELLGEIGRRGVSMQRYKGLGEMSPKQLWETTMDPDSRVLLRVENPDDVEADELFTTLMGKHVEPRREFIKRHATEVENLDI
ncbi:MAG: DNA gyrase subunit B [Methanonatronarchaeales archaeon]|nr:DNA gyrase subunit B [Methanonatronarchaeales archaeon]